MHIGEAHEMPSKSSQVSEIYVLTASDLVSNSFYTLFFRQVLLTVHTIVVKL